MKTEIYTVSIPKSGENGDNFIFFDSNNQFHVCVADGVSNSVSACRSSQKVCLIFKEYCETNTVVNFLGLITEINSNLFSEKNLFSTGVFVTIIEKEAHFAIVGDSILCHVQNNKLFEKGTNFLKNWKISNFLGSKQLVKPIIGQFTVELGDYLVLATDGFYNVFNHFESIILSIIKDDTTIDSKLLQLYQDNKNAIDDDFTCVIIQII